MKDLQKDNWYYVQAFSPDETKYDVKYTICFAPDKQSAIRRVNAWLSGQNFNGAKFHLYHKNYKREAQSMLQAHNLIIA